MRDTNYFSTKRIAFMALFTALVTVATVIIRFPVPSGQGYLNLGDTVVFLCAALFDPVFAMIASGLGSALADVFGGYVAYAPFSLVIKGCEGLIAALIISALRKNKTIGQVVAFVVAGLFMAAGYFLADGILFGWAMGIADVPYNLIQAGANTVPAAILSVALGKIRGVKYVLDLGGGRNGK